ncbi:thioesterase II family protein [Streptomyces sp. NBC_01306]|uniref:thioesterase II family protein n=1 Tax=Streptomyces sp. NBC_01306 TaxID=2903819 RepID=UPI0022544303|nr:alpha/beta fold hydrolase [Streptomyces sp. NBC_01306]MCX4725063.1 alpha/beta fold hydrolase [Streptomyces sp. NBC_01306]
MGSSDNEWITGRHAVGTPRVRLIALPQAGAGAGAFAGWRGRLPAGVELAPVQLPGRGTRAHEPTPADVHALADALFQAVRPELTMPYVLFGHSFGGSLAYELAVRVQQHRLRAPLATLISGSRAPQTPTLRTMSDRDDDTLSVWLARNGGLPKVLLNDEWFLGEILRVVRMDLRWAESYYVPDLVPLNCPLHVFGGAEDEITPPEQLPLWARCTTGEFTVTVLPGGHSFPHSDPDALLAAAQRVLDRPRSTTSRHQ